MPDVVLPVLDEAKAIPWVLDRMPCGYSPVVVDNGSTDGSAEIATRLGAVVVREERRGFGAACWAGLLAARDDVVCFMDCDGSLDPQYLPSVVGPILDGEADLVIGARAPRRGAWPIHARIANRYLAATVRHRTGVHLRDLGPMRAARRRELLGLGLLDRRSGWPLEMVLVAAKRGWRIVDVPVPYWARAGRSKVTGTMLGTLRAIRDMSRVLA
jgi:glycosyltransferase involved in cell wall biosynthesis